MAVIIKLYCIVVYFYDFFVKITVFFNQNSHNLPFRRRTEGLCLVGGILMISIINEGVPQLQKQSFQKIVVRGLLEFKTLAVLKEHNKVLVGYHGVVGACERSKKRVICQVIGPHFFNQLHQVFLC